MRKSLFGLIMMGIIISITGCSKEKLPEDTFTSYLSAWEELDFAAMYGYLSQESKEEIDKQDFIERYENIYSGINVSNLKIDSKLVEKEKQNTENEMITLPYSVTMETLAGPIEFTNEAKLIKEENEKGEDWYIDWGPSLIFPNLEEGEQVSAQIIKATRGEIRDKNGSGLAINANANVVGVVPNKLGDNPSDSKARLAELLDSSIEEIDSKLNASWVRPELFVPISTLPLDKQDIEPFLQVPGVAIQEKVVRTYPFGEAAAHLTGYVREINAEQLEELKDKGYSSGDVIGQSGLESILEKDLKGKNGGHIFIKDKNGEFKETLAKLEPVPGKDIQLTIDAVLQEKIYQQLADEVGTAVALNPTNGSVLSLVSTPAFDPNAFVRGLSEEKWESWSNDENSPFLNRFMNRYTPGSVFKTITAAVGLKTGVTELDEVRKIDGRYWSKDDTWGDYYVTRVHEKSSVTLKDAFVFSDNIFFAQEALEMGKETFIKEATMYGFEEEMEFPFTMTPSTLSNGEIKNEIQLADTAYGQGEVMISPIHLAAIYTAFTNNGDMLYPHLLADDERKVWKENLIDTEIVEKLNDYLLQVVEDPAGTAHGTYIPGMSIAGKTGTAEIKASKDDDSGTENGWFIGYDTENSQLLLTMMIEDVKERGGSSFAIPKVKSIFEFYHQ
ncbi:penicillin-binding transpeptidase domain-containing protein [Ornithinibacillus bavariensis]|uniref:serine-type D-Ala-D-Ala carboxypeptidase n=1 Tax=Ornithinibacillus bavariensis TaxID=545502 RepID=A0A919X9S0_9BACI|nr:penicillin-binding transpeptidase domain-containing protein [Ornithinibacillus bavariensis]GIO28656.1 penicillin-binding protein 3 [Ornithinibacillus bavariensis]